MPATWATRTCCANGSTVASASEHRSGDRADGGNHHGRVVHRHHPGRLVDGGTDIGQHLLHLSRRQPDVAAMTPYASATGRVHISASGPGITGRCTAANAAASSGATCAAFQKSAN